MTTAPARVLKAETLVAIRSVLEDAESAADFLAGVDALLADPERSLALPGIPTEADPLIISDRARGVDVDNGPTVYEHFGALDPANASDPRLWTYLAFVTYRSYLEERWPLHGDRWKGRVEARWMIETPTRGRLVRHGISRLWWVTHLTYDPLCEHPLADASGDPYAYTKAVLGNEDRINALFDREAGAISQASRAVLEHAAESPEYAKDNHVRAVMKGLTLVYGYRDLASLDEAAMRDVIRSILPAAG